MSIVGVITHLCSQAVKVKNRLDQELANQPIIKQLMFQETCWEYFRGVTVKQDRGLTLLMLVY